MFQSASGIPPPSLPSRLTRGCPPPTQVAAAEAAVSAGEAGAEERLSRAEARLEEALDGVLGAEFDFGNEATGLASGESSSSAEEEEEEAAMAFGQPQDEPRRHEAVVHDGATESAFDQACVVDRPAPGSFSKVCAPNYFGRVPGAKRFLQRSSCTIGQMSRRLLLFYAGESLR